MRIFIYIILLFAPFSQSFCQKLFGKENTIEITQKWFFEHSEFKKLDRKEIKIFDKNAKLIKNIQFGFIHNADLNLIGEIRSYEYLENKLISEKTYSDDNDFYNNQMEFYWNYSYDGSRVKTINSNHSDYVYTYNKKNKTIEWVVTTKWDSNNRKYYTRYNHDNTIAEESEYNNWCKKYLYENDTLKITESSFDYPKKGDTTKTYIKEVYRKGKIAYKNKNGFGTNTQKYIYSNDGKLKTVFTSIFDETKKDFKTELIYFPIGIIKQIQEYELENDNWILKQRTDFELNGNPKILNKKEKNGVNEILMAGNKNWL